MNTEKETWREINEKIATAYMIKTKVSISEFIEGNMEVLKELFYEVYFNPYSSFGTFKEHPRGSRIYNIILKTGLFTKQTKKIRAAFNLKRSLWYRGNSHMTPHISVRIKNGTGSYILCINIPIDEEVFQTLANRIR